MGAKRYTRDDFAHALKNLLPTGKAWGMSSGALSKVIRAIATSYERNTVSAVDLLSDSFPSTATSLLPEWENALGLPSKCSGMAPTLQGRRVQVVARLTSSGGQSNQYYINYAKNLGREITITEHAPFRCGQSRCGQHLGTIDWFFLWTVNCNENEIVYFRSGISAAGEPLSAWGDVVLECELSEIAPSHSILNFNYL